MIYNNIYVLAPRIGATGGIELAHQLVDYLRTKGKEAYIVYVDWDTCIQVEDQSVTKEYSQYNIATTSIIDDDANNIIVLPEVFFDAIKLYSKIKIACWWMSVDNRYKRSNVFESFRFEKSLIEKMRIIKRWICNGAYSLKKSDDKLLLMNDDRIIHLYQSVYAQHHLYSKGFSYIRPLSDYINSDLFGDICRERKNVVLYNPAKGYKFTQKIISMMPDTKFVALSGLNKERLRECMETSKLYIDFGNFPGKDRLPREAVINGCCIITSKLGAAYFFEDVPISCSYKFKTSNRNLTKIANRIRYVLNNYDECKSDFYEYREVIIKERSVFKQQVDSIFF